MHSRLIILLILAVSLPLWIAGCTPDSGDLSLNDVEWPDWDSEWVGSVELVLSTHQVDYAAGATGQMSGYVSVFNRNGILLSGADVSICVSDPRVEVRMSSDTTNYAGSAAFTLLTTESGGRVVIRGGASKGLGSAGASDTVTFARSDRHPFYLHSTAQPETLYVDSQHPDSTLIQISVFDAQVRPIPFYSVECPLLTWIYSSCTVGTAQTDTSGIASKYSVRSSYSVPYRRSYRVRAGALIDSVVVTFMPWDSTHGG